MTTEATHGNLRLEASILRALPLADVAVIDVLGFHGDQWDPAEFKPGARFRLHHLCIVASRTHARRAVAFLLDLGRTAKDDGDEEAEVLDFVRCVVKRAKGRWSVSIRIANKAWRLK